MESKISVRKVILGVLACMLAIGLSPPSAQTMDPPETRWYSWSLWAGNDYGTGIAEDQVGNFIVSGNNNDQVDMEMLVGKFSSTGRKQWILPLGGGYTGLDDFTQAVITTSDGCYLLAGSMAYYECPDPTNPPPGGCKKNRAACLIKINSHHKILWKQLYKDFPQSGFNAVVEDVDSNYVAAGFCEKNIVDGTSALLVVKVDKSGNQVDDYHIEQEGFYHSEALGITIRMDEVSGAPNYIVVGYHNVNESSPSGIYIIKLSEIFSLVNQGFYYVTGMDSVGHGVTEIREDLGDYAHGYLVAADLGGKFALVRFKNSFLDGDPKFFGGSVGGLARSIKQSGISGYVAAGSITNGDSSDAYVIHLDAQLDLEWEWKYGGGSGHHFGAWSAIPTHDDGFAVCGYVQDPTKPWTSQYDLFLAKLGGATRTKGKKK